MMESKTPTAELLQKLGTIAIPAEEPDRAAARRERLVPRLATFTRGLHGRRQRARYWVRAGLASAAAAALLALAVGYRARRSGPPHALLEASPSALVALAGSVQVIHQASETQALPLHRVPVGTSDEVMTGRGALARATLPSGAEIDIGPESKIRLAGAWGDEKARRGSSGPGDEAVVLGVGRVAVRVPRLGQARTFSVETPEAIVVVHGTVFSVERRAARPGEEMRTSVDVEQGSVAVRHDGVEVMLQAGDHWSSRSSSGPSRDPGSLVPDTAPPPKPSAAAPVSRSHPPSSGTGGSADGKAADKRSSLAAENRLLTAAMAARQQGDPRRAVRLVGDFLARYPSSPLVEEARVERLRALFAAGETAAAETEAGTYLSDYPQGFARQEAARILTNLPR